MIEVIQRGNPPAEKLYRTQCPDCRSTLQFKRADAEFIADQRDGDCLKIECPVCDRFIYYGLRGRE